MVRFESRAIECGSRMRDFVLWLWQVILAVPLGVAIRPHRYRDVCAANAERIVVVKLDRLGDVVLCSGLFRELRKAAPAASITVVVSSASAALLERCPYVDRVLSVGDAVPAALDAVTRPFRCWYLGLRLRRSLPDLAIVARWDADLHGATWVAYASGAPRRVGFSEGVSRRKQRVNRGFDRFYTEAISTSGIEHEVSRNLSLLQHLGCQIGSTELELWPAPEDLGFASDVLRFLGASGNHPIIAFGIGATHPKRRWPTERYAEVARRLNASAAGRFVLIGGPNDSGTLRMLSESIAGIPLWAHVVGLRQVVAIISGCQLFIGPDSGPMHIAAACGVPVVEISCHPRSGDPGHDNSPVRFGPWGTEKRILQPDAASPYCLRGCTSRTSHCIEGVSVERVVLAAMEILGTLPPP
jgi:heptosyltransferase-2